MSITPTTSSNSGLTAIAAASTDYTFTEFKLEFFARARGLPREMGARDINQKLEELFNSGFRVREGIVLGIFGKSWPVLERDGEVIVPGTAMKAVDAGKSQSRLILMEYLQMQLDQVQKSSGDQQERISKVFSESIP